MRDKKTQTENFDLKGVSIFRMLCHWIRGQIVLMGGSSQAPRFRQLMILFLLHYMGKPLYYVKARAQHCALIRKIVHKLRAR